VAELFGLAPAKAVKVGNTWKRDTKMSMGPIGDFKMASEYKYATAAAAGDKVTWTAKATYTAPKAGGAPKPTCPPTGSEKASATADPAASTRPSIPSRSSSESACSA
jgi:hypothetical protein